MVAIGRDSVAIGRENSTSFWRFVAIRSRFGRDSVAIRSRKLDFLLAFCRDSVAIGRNRSRLARRFGRDSVAIGQPMVAIGRDSVAIGRENATSCWRFVAIGRNRSRFGAPNTRCKHKKSPISSRDRAARVSMRLACLVNRLIPHVNTCASARIVLRVQAPQWCIVMPTSVRRNIGRYI